MTLFVHEPLKSFQNFTISVSATVKPAVWNLMKTSIGVVKQATIYDSSNTNTVVNLTGKTVTLKVWANDPLNPILNEAISVTNAPGGVVQWTVSSGDIASLDVNLSGYKAELVASSSGYVSPSYPFSLIVRPAA